MAVNLSRVLAFLGFSKNGELARSYGSEAQSAAVSLLERVQFSQSNILDRAWIFLGLMLLFATVALAEWQPIGSMKAEKPQGNQFTFSSPRAKVVVTVLAS